MTLSTNNVADFIYKTSNTFVKENAVRQGDIAYVNSFNMKRSIVGWRDKFETLMKNYEGKRFTFEELDRLVKEKGFNEDPRYEDIIIALWESLKPHYIDN